MNISLRPITADNYLECIALDTAPEQVGLVAPNAASLAEAQLLGTLTARAVYAGNTMVGFIMYGVDPIDRHHWIYRLLIDKAHQRQGYGRAAVTMALECLAAMPGCQEVRIGYRQHNEAARRLYRQLGFQETGEKLLGQVIARLPVAALP